ncbi:MAG: type II toxin-antitoxin system prevent-host-death family antitoxin [Spirochaetaceae bacterium]|nr:type II toxin-antitoxin system prevent-host-death family antitoxin [Spirochaetaceae bacterium]MDT8297604.1 type II toxin-antitoxin system prevent-host-death family antitoxin [Spirochaetaceae bacterium]
MVIVSFTEARKRLKSILDRVADDRDATIITRRDAEDSVVMSLDTYNSIMETLYLLRSPANARHIEESLAQFEQGQTVERELVDD